MAKVLGPLHSDHVKGSVSGLTYREYRGMATTTRRPRPVARITMPLSNVRSILEFLSREWSRLTADEKLQWLQYAQSHPVPNGFGGTFQLDGNQMYQKLNNTVLRLYSEGVIQDSPPTEDPTSNIDTLVAAGAVTPGTITLDWTHLGTPGVNYVTEVQIAGYFSSEGRVSVESRFRYLAKVAVATETYDAENLLVDGWYWFRVRHVTDHGVCTGWVSAQAQCVVPV